MLHLQLDVIRARCASTAKWRESMITRYPNDSARNTAAHNLLRALAVLDDDDTSPATKSALAKLHGPAFATACTEVCRAVGFKFVPESLDDVARAVISRVAEPQAEDDHPDFAPLFAKAGAR